MNSPFFTKREPQTFANRTSAGSQLGGFTNSTSPSSPDTAQARAVESSSAAASAAASEQSSGSKLTVGPNIKLKGVEITDCDTLVVEGTVEATMDSRVIQIAEQGAFRGSAEIDIAEIHGEFTGSLTVRQKLVIHSTGKVSGKIRYGKIVIEEGGQLSGEIEVGVGPRSGKSASTSSTSSAASGSTASGSSSSTALAV